MRINKIKIKNIFNFKYCIFKINIFNNIIFYVKIKPAKLQYYFLKFFI
jgi:hypothetical protein